MALRITVDSSRVLRVEKIPPRFFSGDERFLLDRDTISTLEKFGNGLSRLGIEVAAEFAVSFHGRRKGRTAQLGSGSRILPPANVQTENIHHSYAHRGQPPYRASPINPLRRKRIFSRSLVTRLYIYACAYTRVYACISLSALFDSAPANDEISTAISPSHRYHSALRHTLHPLNMHEGVNAKILEKWRNAQEGDRGRFAPRPKVFQFRSRADRRERENTG